MRFVKAIFLIGILTMPIGISTFISFDDDDSLYELFESMNEEEEEEGDDENKHETLEFLLEYSESRETVTCELIGINFYSNNQLFQSVKLEVQTPPPRA